MRLFQSCDCVCLDWLGSLDALGEPLDCLVIDAIVAAEVDAAEALRPRQQVAQGLNGRHHQARLLQVQVDQVRVILHEVLKVVDSLRIMRCQVLLVFALHALFFSQFVGLLLKDLVEGQSETCELPILANNVEEAEPGGRLNDVPAEVELSDCLAPLQVPHEQLKRLRAVVRIHKGKRAQLGTVKHRSQQLCDH